MDDHFDRMRLLIQVLYSSVSMVTRPAASDSVTTVVFKPVRNSVVFVAVVAGVGPGAL